MGAYVPKFHPNLVPLLSMLYINPLLWKGTRPFQKAVLRPYFPPRRNTITRNQQCQQSLCVAIPPDNGSFATEKTRLPHKNTYKEQGWLEWRATCRSFLGGNGVQNNHVFPEKNSHKQGNSLKTLNFSRGWFWHVRIFSFLTPPAFQGAVMK